MSSFRFTDDQANSVERSYIPFFPFSVSPAVNTLHCCCSVAQSCLTPCDLMGCSMPGFPVVHYLPELVQLIFIELVMPSNHLILCCPLLLLPSIFPSIKVFSNESGLPGSGQSIGASASATVLHLIHLVIHSVNNSKCPHVPVIGPGVMVTEVTRHSSCP